MPLCRAVIDQNVFVAGFEHRGRAQGAQQHTPCKSFNSKITRPRSSSESRKTDVD